MIALNYILLYVTKIENSLDLNYVCNYDVDANYHKFRVSKGPTCAWTGRATKVNQEKLCCDTATIERRVEEGLLQLS